MKLLLLFLLPLSSMGQNNLNGKYCWRDGFSSICIQFINEDSVFYQTTGCMPEQDINTMGTYTISGDTLRLNFITEESDADTFLLNAKCTIAMDTVCDTDSIDCTVMVRQLETQKPLAFAPIYLSSTENPTEEEKLEFTHTDFDGIAQLRFKKEEKTVWLSTSSIGTDEKTAAIKTDTCSFVQFELAKRDPYHKKLKSLTFIITEITEDSLSLMELGGRYATTFKRKK